MKFLTEPIVSVVIKARFVGAQIVFGKQEKSMLKFASRLGGSAALVVSLVAMIGCSSSSTKESASKQELTKDVGNYPPPPSGNPTPRVGVPQFNVTTGPGFSNSHDLNDQCADICTYLLTETGRFVVIERAQLPQLIKEQSLEGIVASPELAKQAQVHGVDYLLLGKVDNIRVKRSHTSNGFGVAQIGGMFGGGDVKNKETIITSECGVNLRLVDPTTGAVLVASGTDFKRTDSAKSMGVQILGANAESEADVDVSEDSKGAILKLALDEAIKKMLPKIDAKFKNLPPKPAAPAPAPAQ
ncbi:MAG TPA: CsgG/HfaB family protein [Humisphaera sp.]|jgi:curli biogenesis system outer membrane secretion channel CsgG|nr:CsgG/HfaB family protein [Humisphaera sp.]